MSSTTVQAVNRDDIVPRCAFCESDLHEIYTQKLRRGFGMGRAFVFFCPHCRKTLGQGTQWYPFPG